MKHTRRFALLLCFALMLSAATASAEVKKSKTFTTAPTIKITGAPTTGTASAGSIDFNINASVPGFLTVQLVDASGYPVLTIADNMEIHSKDTHLFLRMILTEQPLIAVGNLIHLITMQQ